MQNGPIRHEDLKQWRKAYRQAPRKAVVLYHIHKTGGRSLGKALERHFANDTIIRVSSPSEHDQFLKDIENGALSSDGTYYIYGHRTRDVADAIRNVIPVLGLTILRDPVDLFASHFSYQHTRHGKKDLTTEAYLERYGQNFMLQLLKFQDSADALSKADDYFSFVAINENLSASMSMLAWLLGIRAKAFVSQNIASADDYVEFDQACLPKFVRENMDDLIFYETMKLRHSQMFRRFKQLDNFKLIDFEQRKASIHKPTPLNFDLDRNKGKFSLLLTGMEVWKDDRARATEFFDKAFREDWALAERIFRHIEADDPAKAREWARSHLGYIQQQNGPEAERISRLLTELSSTRTANRVRALFRKFTGSEA